MRSCIAGYMSYREDLYGDLQDERANREPAEAGTPTPALDRRYFMQAAGGILATAGLGSFAIGQSSSAQTPPGRVTPGHPGNLVQLPQVNNTSTESPEKAPGPFSAPSERVGFAIVGLGRLSIDEILPAFGRSKLCKPVALVSGDATKAQKLAAQYGIPSSSVYDYAGYDRLKDNPAVKVIYIVLPNSMHLEYTLRGAKTGKHILCEKPMAVSSAEAETMIAACKAASVKLMIAYRQQYEPNNREIVKMVKAGKLGKLGSFVATNSQNQGDASQWRLKRALAGGGCLPDVGLYCLNAARFLSGEEPIEVSGFTHQAKEDPRFAEVESTCSFTLRFPSGLLAICNTGYNHHKSQSYRLEGSDAWAELSPAFAYHGNKLKVARLLDEHDTELQPTIPEKDQFAAEMDHMAECVLENKQPHTPGEEGLQDHRLMEAIYESARTGRSVKVSSPSRPTRGPEPTKQG